MHGRVTWDLELSVDHTLQSKSQLARARIAQSTDLAQLRSCPRTLLSVPPGTSIGGADSWTGGDTAKTDEPDTVQSMPVGLTNIHLTVHGGTGGSGGTAMSIWRILMQL
ncbi:hypothetical protein MVEN_00124400 [Mycena venus]|uniref:Uncharacterized protein n=1 Tax=Mycena venus TaxID=2733690 RepID=A0A8H7DHP1_9AGAR|nr:hypothetical protein MVEN_00124400 [Mycena venus]